MSYSKNPLGVRTPTSAVGTGSVLQQQQQGFQSQFGSQTDDRSSGPRRGPGVVSPQSQYLASPPPPRFFSSSPSNFDHSSSAPLTGMADVFIPRNDIYSYSLSSNMGPSTSSFSPFGISNNSTIPGQSDTDHRNDRHSYFIPRAMSPPSHNIEAARVG